MEPTPSAADKAPAPPAEPYRLTKGARFLSGLFATGCLAVLVIAAWLSPSADGHGTHTQLGMAPCGFMMAFEKPCPTCGMTTSFTHAAHADPVGAFKTQPAGATLALITAAVFWGALHSAVTGSRLGSAASRILGWKALAVALAAVGAAWVYKIQTTG